MKLLSLSVLLLSLLSIPIVCLSSDELTMAELFQPQQVSEMNTLRAVVVQSIATNPEVLASWEIFQSVEYEQDAAWGGYLPSVDVTGRAGYEGYRSNSQTSDYQTAEVSFAFTQMLYDGFLTRDEVERLSAEKLVRLCELLEMSENTALTVVTAYVDVVRYRNLLAYAEENLAQHQEVFDQVKERVDAGISRGVDLDQATGRLALARSNWMTESNNLHDVSARFLRLVGELPAATLQPPAELTQIELPEKIEAALLNAFQQNPTINAAFNRVSAARKAKDARESAFHPRIELRAHHDMGAERDLIKGNSNETVVEVVATVNLYRGGSDYATVKQFTSYINQVVDLRNRACRDVRQILTIAYNSIGHLERQLDHLKAHLQSSEKARQAYRDQFDIGQRTLLDLLDTENEYFQARRAYTIASYDYVLAHARSAQGMGTLLSSLGVRNNNVPLLNRLISERDELGAISFCTEQAVPDHLVEKGSISAQPWLK